MNSYHSKLKVAPNYAARTFGMIHKRTKNIKIIRGDFRIGRLPTAARAFVALFVLSSSSSSYRCYCYCWLSELAIVLVELIHCIMFGCEGEGCDGHKERIKFDLDSQCKRRDAILARL